VGPEWVPGHPAAHGSGFYWGDERLPVDFGFRFAPPVQEEDGEAPAEPPAHPSGFRFAAGAPRPTPEQFRWAAPLEAARFRWRTRRVAPPAEAAFRWKG
jgi:hypothetical protein